MCRPQKGCAIGAGASGPIHDAEPMTMELRTPIFICFFSDRYCLGPSRRLWGLWGLWGLWDPPGRPIVPFPVWSCHFPRVWRSGNPTKLASRYTNYSPGHHDGSWSGGRELTPMVKRIDVPANLNPPPPSRGLDWISDVVHASQRSPCQSRQKGAPLVAVREVWVAMYSPLGFSSGVKLLEWFPSPILQGS